MGILVASIILLDIVVHALYSGNRKERPSHRRQIIVISISIQDVNMIMVLSGPLDLLGVLHNLLSGCLFC